jgi:hypothetical protein
MEDSLTEPIPTDVLAYNSYWDNFRGRSPLFPEQALMLAVLEDAIFCVQRHGRISRSKACREAVDWILEKNSDQLFSFENICAVLLLDAEYLRKGLLTWQGKEAVKISRPQVVPVKKNVPPPRSIDLRPL